MKTARRITRRMNPDERLAEAVLAGDLDGVRAALHGGASPDARRSYSQAWDRELLHGTESALHCAVNGGHTAIVELLLAHGADPNVRDSLSGRTPLTDAAGRGDLPLVERLLAANASGEALPGSDGDNAFTVAIGAGRADVALVLARAKVSMQPRALDLACHLGRIDLAELCRRCGLSPAKLPGLESAARSGHVPMLRWLVEQGVDLRRYGAPALCEAANAGRADAVTFLLEHAVPVDCRNSYGWSPLLFAAYNGDARTVAVLLQAGADPKADDGRGRTALDWAREAGKHENVAVLERALRDGSR